MITIIHGDDVASSRNYLQKSRSDSALEERDATTLTMTDLVQFFDGGNLFNESKNMLIEHFISERQKTPEYDALVAYIINLPSSSHVVIWEPKELTKPALNPYIGADIKTYKFPSTLFAFLDGLTPNSGIRTLSLFHKTIEHTDVEMVFFMLIRHIRLLLAMNQAEVVQIDEVKRLQSWQKSKLSSQAKLFSSDKLVYLYEKLHELDVKQKTGELALPLPSAIDFWLLSL